MEEATELEYLRWFAQNSDFGPADEDVVRWMQDNFREQTGKEVPSGWNRNIE